MRNVYDLFTNRTILMVQHLSNEKKAEEMFSEMETIGQGYKVSKNTSNYFFRDYVTYACGHSAVRWGHW